MPRRDRSVPIAEKVQTFVAPLEILSLLLPRLAGLATRQSGQPPWVPETMGLSNGAWE